MEFACAVVEMGEFCGGEFAVLECVAEFVCAVVALRSFAGCYLVGIWRSQGPPRS